MYLNSLYKTDYTFLKVLGINENKIIKLVTMNCIKNEIEEELELKIIKDKVEKNSVNDEKLKNNICRARQNIFELAFCNEWEYFITLTLNANKYNREDLEKYHKDLTQFIRDKNKKYKCKIDFLLIPELHKDGKTWHFHGLIKGIPKEYLKEFKLGDKMSSNMAIKVKLGDKLYNWIDYYNKFGFCDLEEIKNHSAVAKYITKYISKELGNTVKELGAHLYYHSRGLNKSITVKKGYLINDVEHDYIGEYCKITEFAYDENLLNELKNNIVSSYETVKKEIYCRDF